VRGIFGFIGVFAGGSLGWWLGGLWALPAAMVLGAVGSGMGLYWGRRLFQHWLE
jgi:hypothetical protein